MRIVGNSSGTRTLYVYSVVLYAPAEKSGCVRESRNQDDISWQTTNFRASYRQQQQLFNSTDPRSLLWSTLVNSGHKALLVKGKKICVRPSQPILGTCFGVRRFHTH